MSGRRGFVDRVRGLVLVALLVAVNLPALWVVFRSPPDDACSASASIVEETPPTNVPENALSTMLPEHPQGWPVTIDSPTDLTFAAQGHGSTPGAERDWREALMLHGFHRGRLIAWRASVGSPSMSINASEFSSPGDALSFHRWAAGWSCRFMTDVFEVSALPGAVGTRFNWRDGHTSEQISFVRGDLRAVVLATVDGAYRRDDLTALALVAYDEVGSPGG